MRHQKALVGAIGVLLLARGAESAAEGADAPNSGRLRLRTLQQGCAVTVGDVEKPDPKTGVWLFPGHRAAWLNCGCGPVLILYPLNLVGKVRIKTGEEALEYVRVFTNAESYALFRLNNMVEVIPGKVTATSEFNVVTPERFERCCREAKVSVGDSIAGMKVFYVTRTVVQLDQGVYEIVEEVREDGYYQEISRARVASTAELGIVHVGED